MNLNNRGDLEWENYFSGIRASFFRKFFSTFFDLVYLLCFNLPLFIIIAYHKQGQNIIQTFKNFTKTTETIDAWRMLVFATWMFFCCYVYFVFLPSKTKYQTFFSNNFGIRAVGIYEPINWDKRPSQLALFKANLVPVFSLLILNIVFFGLASIFNNSDWKDKLLKTSETKWIPAMRTAAVTVFALQIHYAFTVGASKKALNWFVKSNGIIYVHARKASVMSGTEDKPLLHWVEEKENDLNMPGVNTLALKSLRNQKQTKKLDEFDQIDFSEEIEI